MLFHLSVTQASFQSYCIQISDFLLYVMHEVFQCQCVVLLLWGTEGRASLISRFRYFKQAWTGLEMRLGNGRLNQNDLLVQKSSSPNWSPQFTAINWFSAYTCITRSICSLVPRPLPDFISQPQRKLGCCEIKSGIGLRTKLKYMNSGINMYLVLRVCTSWTSLYTLYEHACHCHCFVGKSVFHQKQCR